MEVQKANDDGTDIAELMRIFTITDAYNFEKFPKVSKRKKQFKESEGGNEKMCDLVENYANQRAKEAAEKAAKEAAEKAAKEAAEKAAKEAAEKADSAKKFFENGVSYDIVRASISSISDEDLKNIYEQVTGNSN